MCHKEGKGPLAARYAKEHFRKSFKLAVFKTLCKRLFQHILLRLNGYYVVRFVKLPGRAEFFLREEKEMV